MHENTDKYEDVEFELLVTYTFYSAYHYKPNIMKCRNIR